MELSSFLENIYSAYNDPQYIHPDPLETVLPVSKAEDREIAGLIASSLALGNVRAMLPAIRRVMEGLSPSSLTLPSLRLDELEEIFQDFRYRFFTGGHIARFIYAIGRVIDREGSIEAFFLRCYREEGGDTIRGLNRFASRLNRYGEGKLGILIPLPEKGSACKRLLLYLRWMVRKDAVDQGHWDFPADKLLVPVDTHMLSIARSLGLTSRKQASMKTALEISDAFRVISPKDPVKYDFSLTRLGIRPELDLGSVVSDYGYKKENPRKNGAA